jgi:hypothetical protein
MCEECNWSEWSSVLEEMDDDPAYSFASDTIRSISDWVEENQHITEKQQKALVNIHRSRGRSDGEWSELFHDVGF